MAPSPPPDHASLRREARDLLLVAMGAVPGALVRWRLEDLGKGWEGPATGLIEADLAANLIGTFLIGVIAAQRPPRPRLLLLGAIGFCGSLTTFSSWMLDVTGLLRTGRPLAGLLLIVASLALGLLCAAGGLGLSRLLFRRRGSG